MLMGRQQSVHFEAGLISMAGRLVNRLKKLMTISCFLSRLATICLVSEVATPFMLEGLD